MDDFVGSFLSSPAQQRQQHHKDNVRVPEQDLSQAVIPALDCAFEVDSTVQEEHNALRQYCTTCGCRLRLGTDDTHICTRCNKATPLLRGSTPFGFDAKSSDAPPVPISNNVWGPDGKCEITSIAPTPTSQLVPQLTPPTSRSPTPYSNTTRFGVTRDQKNQTPFGSGLELDEFHLRLDKEEYSSCFGPSNKIHQVMLITDITGGRVSTERQSRIHRIALAGFVIACVVVIIAVAISKDESDCLLCSTDTKFLLAGASCLGSIGIALLLLSSCQTPRTVLKFYNSKNFAKSRWFSKYRSPVLTAECDLSSYCDSVQFVDEVLARAATFRRYENPEHGVLKIN